MSRRRHSASLSRAGFTLVEILVVIVIIGILAGMITAAAMVARGRVREAVTKADVSQMAMALDRYKTEVGEYPPDFYAVDDLVSGSPSPVAIDARNRVIQHLRRRFPRYVPRGITNPPKTYTGADAAFQRFVDDVRYLPNGNQSPYYNYNPETFDPTSALAFWLGGLPEDPAIDDSKLAGFHTDPTDPFRVGGPRTQAYFEFNTARLVPYEPDSQVPTTTRYLRYYPQGVTTPYVYFRARRSPSTSFQEYGVVRNGEMVPFSVVFGADNVAVPYLDWRQNDPDPLTSNPAPYVPTNPARPNVPVRRWRNPDSYQLLSPGVDGFFGFDGASFTFGTSGTDWRPWYRYTRLGVNFDEDGYDADNITNFAEGRLEVEVQQQQ